ncbi:MAG: hypothetical protein QOK42_217 [Frankiaceae bacterium]|jgi:hypothetical protein|nr:hypothetical protein [Frankiaceae bacterium]MDX6274375.1 hypothetical protein [Frankiales bacterium]
MSDLRATAKRLATSGVALAGLIAVVGGLGVAEAATGGTLILGARNDAGAITTLTGSAGTPLGLNAPSGYAPLTVNSPTRVTNLNSDLLDGVDSTALQRRVTGACSLTGVATVAVAGGVGCAVARSYAFRTSYSWTIPVGVHMLDVTAWGGGGGGGSSGTTPGGGGAGAKVEELVSVSAGQVLAITVGAGGTPGSNGGTTSLKVSATNTLLLETGGGGAGGSGGTGACSSTRVSGGYGGVSTRPTSASVWLLDHRFGEDGNSGYWDYYCSAVRGFGGNRAEPGAGGLGGATGAAGMAYIQIVG